MLSRPRDPEALIDEEAFADDEFMPYWAELWPAALELAEALPASLAGLRVIELGCGLGMPSLVAAARGAVVTALDWAEPAVELLRGNAERNGLSVAAVHADWRAYGGDFDLVLGSDLLYEARNAAALLELLPRLAPEAILAEPGRPHAAGFFRQAAETWTIEPLGARVARLTRTTREGRRLPEDE